MDQPTRRLAADSERTADPPRRSAGPTPQTEQCRVCGGEARPFAVQTQEGLAWKDVQIRAPDGPRALPLIGARPASTCAAWVCQQCGYTEFYTVDPARLFAE